jgi:hypothetical protein
MARLGTLLIQGRERFDLSNLSKGLEDFRIDCGKDSGEGGLIGGEYSGESGGEINGESGDINGAITSLNVTVPNSGAATPSGTETR